MCALIGGEAGNDVSEEEKVCHGEGFEGSNVGSFFQFQRPGGGLRGDEHTGARWSSELRH